MYNRVYYDRPTKVMYIWDDVNGLEEFTYVPYCYKKTDKVSKLKNLYGEFVEKTFYEKNPSYYEIDIRPESRVLLDRYYNEDEPAKNVIEFMDIETDSKDGFPNKDKGDKTIISITSFIDSCKVFILYDRTISFKRDGVEIYKFETEEELLNAYFQYIHSRDVSISLAWNGDDFDFWYIYNRLKRIKYGSYKWSSIGIVDKNDDYGYIKVAGLNLIDYMKLYKNPLFRNKLPSYSLDNVAQHELGYGKVKHKGLDYLYENDIDEFVKYAVRDVQIMVDIEKKKEILKTMIELCHESHIPYEWFHNTSNIVEGGIFTYLKRNNIVSINNVNKDRIQAFFVQDVMEDALIVTENIPNYISNNGTLQLMNSNGKSAKKDRYGNKYLIEYDSIINNKFILISPIEFKIKKGDIVKVNLSGAYVLEPKPGLYI